MARANVNPTRQELRNLKNRLKTAVRGHKLLKDKSDEMIRLFSILIRENKTLRDELERELSSALSSFSSAKAMMDERRYEEAFLMPTSSVQLVCKEKSILSVSLPQIDVIEENSRERYPYNFSTVPSEADDSVVILGKLIPKLMKLAEVEKACNILASEIEKNKRRVNALEYILIPQYQETIRYITMKLDENERSSTTRLMKVKKIISE